MISICGCFVVILFVACVLSIIKTCLYNFDPLKARFYIVELKRYTFFLLIFAWNILLVLVRTPREPVLTSTQQSFFWAEIWKNIFLSKHFQFLEMKFSIDVNRRVFVMFLSLAVVPVLVLLFVAFFYEAICFMSYLVLFCSCIFSVFLPLRLPRLGKSEVILVRFVRLFDLCLFGFVGFLFLLVSEKGCGLWLWRSLRRF